MSDDVETLELDSNAEGDSPGLPWPKTWNGVYYFVFASFLFWLVLLIALTEFFS